jgi:predicted RNA methylase
MAELPPCDSQWNDFLVRRYDAYAMAKYDLILQWLGDVRGCSVLVAGCGSGELAVRLALAGARVTAFDIDEPTVALTREAARAAGVELLTRVAPSRPTRTTPATTSSWPPTSSSTSRTTGVRPTGSSS